MRRGHGCFSKLPPFRLFLQLHPPQDFNKCFTNGDRSERGPESKQAGVIMEETAQKSCWGVTIRALAGFAAFLALTYIFGSP
jgi:hypothetical protein